MTRRFGQHTKEELAEARTVATEQMETWGDLPNAEVWHQFRTKGIWNDHISVQCALQVIMDRNDKVAGVQAAALERGAIECRDLDLRCTSLLNAMAAELRN